MEQKCNEILCYQGINSAEMTIHLIHCASSVQECDAKSHIPVLGSTYPKGDPMTYHQADKSIQSWYMVVDQANRVPFSPW